MDDDDFTTEIDTQSIVSEMLIDTRRSDRFDRPERTAVRALGYDRCVALLLRDPPDPLPRSRAPRASRTMMAPRRVAT